MENKYSTTLIFFSIFDTSYVLHCDGMSSAPSKSCIRFDYCGPSDWWGLSGKNCEMARTFRSCAVKVGSRVAPNPEA